MTQKRLSKLYQNPNQHMIEEKSKGIKSNNTQEIRQPIENRIPNRSKDTNRGLLLESFK